MRLCKGVLGSGENGVKRYREQRKAISIKQKILGIVSSNLTQFLIFFFASLHSAIFLTSNMHFHQQETTFVANDRNLGEQGDDKNNLGRVRS